MRIFVFQTYRQMIHKIVYPILFLLTILSVQSCRHDDDDIRIPEPEEDASRTVLVYMLSAVNSLGGYSTQDIAEMRKAAVNGDIGDGRLIIFHSADNGTQVMQEMLPDGSLDTLKIYDPEIRPQTVARMNEVINDAKTFAPAEDYGLVLWGHGTGWIEDGMTDSSSEVAQPYSYGSEHNERYKMNVTSLARVLEGKDFSFIYFDCCYMASVEVMYQLRNVTPVIVASSSEVMGWGMPYDRNIKHFFAEEPEMIEAAQETVDFYANIGDNVGGLSESEIKMCGYCTISVINTAGLDRLAAVTRSIYAGNTVGIPSGYTPQSFTLNRNNYYCDLGGYVNALNATDEQREAFDGAMNETVLLSLSTGQIWGRLEIREHSGLTTFIMESDNQSAVKNYYALDWYNDVASELIK